MFLKKNQSAPRPSEHPPVKTFMFYFILFFILVRKNPVYRDSNSCPNVLEGPRLSYRGELVFYQTYPKTIDSSRPLLSRVTPGRHAPIDCSLPLYYKHFSMAVTLGASRFIGLGISLPISSIHGYVTLSLNGRVYSLGMQVSYQTCPRVISLHPPKW